MSRLPIPLLAVLAWACRPERASQPPPEPRPEAATSMQAEPAVVEEDPAEGLRRPLAASLPQAAPAAREWENSIGMSFRVIEPGEFSMEIPAVTNKTAVELTRERIEAWARGEPPPPIKERPHRTVRLTKAYAVGLRAVTAGEFEKVMGRPAEHQSRDWRVHGNPDLPAAGVSWEEAAEFCRRLSERAGEKDALRRYRLPTEAEWSRAVEVEACCDPGARWNLLPIHWAVWEWCSDWFDEGYHREMPAVDPAGPPAGESHLARLAWSHADPFVDQYTFRVVAESP